MDLKPSELEAAQAAQWYSRLRAEDCTVAERRAFAVWLTQEPGRARAYEQAKLLLGRVDVLVKTDPRMRDLAAAALRVEVTPERPAVRQWRVAAALLLGIGVAATLALQPSAVERPAATSVAHYENGDLKQQHIELADGSGVYLDVGARLDVRIGKSERSLHLQAGRAYFEVAHDASRPFTVQAGGTRTVALGTRFQVALASQQVSITLAEGSVAVSSVAASEGWNEVLRPGEQLQFSAASGDRNRHGVDPSVVVGWSYGRLMFKGAQLIDALEEINRYSAVKLRLGEASIGSMPVGGTFVAGADSAQVAAALAAALPLSAVQVGASEIVLFRRYDTGS